MLRLWQNQTPTQLKYNGDTDEDLVNTFRPSKKNKIGCYFANDIFLYSDLIYYRSVWVKIMVWRKSGKKPTC